MTLHLEQLSSNMPPSFAYHFFVCEDFPSFFAIRASIARLLLLGRRISQLIFSLQLQSLLPKQEISHFVCIKSWKLRFHKKYLVNARVSNKVIAKSSKRERFIQQNDVMIAFHFTFLFLPLKQLPFVCFLKHFHVNLVLNKSKQTSSSSYFLYLSKF